MQISGHIFQNNSPKIFTYNKSKRNTHDLARKRGKDSERSSTILKVKVRQERENFDVDHMPLPQGVANDPRAVARVKFMMGRYRDQVLAGVEVPDLDAKVFDMRARQAFAVLQALGTEITM